MASQLTVLWELPLPVLYPSFPPSSIYRRCDLQSNIPLFMTPVSAWLIEIMHCRDEKEWYAPGPSSVSSYYAPVPSSLSSYYASVPSSVSGAISIGGSSSHRHSHRQSHRQSHQCKKLHIMHWVLLQCLYIMHQFLLQCLEQSQCKARALYYNWEGVIT